MGVAGTTTTRDLKGSVFEGLSASILPALIVLDDESLAMKNPAGQNSMPRPENSFRLPEGCIERKTLKRILINVLTEDLSFHEQIKRALCIAGFKIIKIEKHWFHHVYELRMQRGAAMRDDTQNQLRRKIRSVLKAEGINYDQGTFALGVHGQQLVCAFCYRFGAEGAI